MEYYVAKVRLQKYMTIRELSEKSGVAKSHIQQNRVWGGRSKPGGHVPAGGSAGVRSLRALQIQVVPLSGLYRIYLVENTE